MFVRFECVFVRLVFVCEVSLVCEDCVCVFVWFLCVFGGLCVCLFGLCVCLCGLFVYL